MNSKDIITHALNIINIFDRLSIVELQILSLMLQIALAKKIQEEFE